MLFTCVSVYMCLLELPSGTEFVMNSTIQRPLNFCQSTNNSSYQEIKLEQQQRHRRRIACSPQMFGIFRGLWLEVVGIRGKL